MDFVQSLNEESADCAHVAAAVNCCERNPEENECPVVAPVPRTIVKDNDRAQTVEYIQY